MEKNLNKILEEILEKKERKDDREENRFLELIDQVVGHVDLKVARNLMKTFLAKPDYGTQERVISAILSGSREIYIQAILEELPRLKSEASHWAETLLCSEIEHHPELIEKMAKLIPDDAKEALRSILRNDEISSEYPNAQKIVV